MELDEILERRERISLGDVHRFLASGDLTTRAKILDYVYCYPNHISPKFNEEWLRDELYRLTAC